jgi:hypothetical protein
MNAVATKMTGPVQSARAKRHRNRRRGGRGQDRHPASSLPCIVPAKEKGFKLTGLTDLTVEERNQKVREYFAWAATKGLDSSKPFHIDYSSTTPTDKELFSGSYSVWEKMRNSAWAMEKGLEYLAESFNRFSGDAFNVIFPEAVRTLSEAFAAQKMIYRTLVKEANDFRRSNLVWDSGDMTPLDITLKA